MKKVEISIYCASDRFNYGDLLFPLILHKFISLKISGVNIDNYAMEDSDLSSLGGMPTHGLKRLISDGRKKNNHYVIVAGGEVLGATWFKLYRYILPQKFSFLCRIINKLFSQNILDSVVRKLYSSRLVSPFVLSAEEFGGNTKIIFNTVGGSSLEAHSNSFRKRIASIVEESLYVSVRDYETETILKENGVRQVHLAPDSAVVMSDLFPSHELNQMVCQEVEKIFSDFSKGYWCFQVSEDHARNNLEVIAAQIDKVHQQFNIGVVLLPIGRASGHEDQIPLRKISERLNSPWRLPESIGVFDIMALIAGSRLYAGTSLHGVITSTSFAVPRIGLTHKVPKLAAHLKCWDITEFQHCVEFEELAMGADSAMRVSEEILNDKCNELIGKANFVLNQLVKEVNNDASIELVNHDGQ